MRDASAGGIFFRHIPDNMKLAVKSGHYKVLGSTIRDGATGQIRGFLQEAPLMAKVARVGAGTVPVIGDVAQSAQLEHIASGVEAIQESVELLQILGIANLVLGGANLGVQVAGLAVMSRKLDRLKQDLSQMAQRLEALQAGVDELRQDRLDDDLSVLAALAEQFEEGWRMSPSGAEDRWRHVARQAVEVQRRFERRALRALSGGAQTYDLARPLLESVALANALRVSALCACDEATAAGDAALDGGLALEALTGSLGLADFVTAALSIQRPRPGSPQWSLAQAEAKVRALDLAHELRHREAAAYTRAAPLAELKRRGIRPRDWMEEARSEPLAALLFLPAIGQTS